MSVSGSDYVDITAVNASGDLTSSQYFIVKTTGVDTTYSAGNLTCKICTSSTGGINGPKGVLQNDPDTGQAAIIRVQGLTKVISGEAIAVGNFITAGSCGHAVIADTTGAFYIGVAETAATASLQIINARLHGLAGSFAASTA